MSILGDIANILQKPQSVAMGSLAGLMRMIDPSQDVENRLGVGNDPLSGLMAGLKGNIRPSEVAKALENDYTWGQESLPDKAMNTVLDVGLDPLMLAGPAIKSGLAGSRAAEIASKLGSAGNYAEGLSRGEKLTEAAARALRRTYQGTLATGDPLSGFAAGQIMGFGENQLAKRFPEIFGKLVRNADNVAEDLPSAVQTAGGAVARQGEEVLTPDAVIQALNPGRQPVGALGPATARIGDVGARPMGPASNVMSDVSFPRQQGNFLDELANEAVAKSGLPGAVGTPSSVVSGPSSISDVLIDPTLQGKARDEYILNQLEEILRRNR